MNPETTLTHALAYAWAHCDLRTVRILTYALHNVRSEVSL